MGGVRRRWGRCFRKYKYYFLAVKDCTYANGHFDVAVQSKKLLTDIKWTLILKRRIQ